MTERDEYFLGYRQDEQERLQRQAQELAGESRDFFEAPETLVLSHLFVQVWGRKPAHP